MAEVSFSSNGMESLLNESLHEVSELRSQVTKLTNKNEEYQQTIHVLRRELDSKNAMYEEVKELLEEVSNQQSERIDNLTQAMTDKHNEERKCFNNRIQQLEEDLASKMNDNEAMESLVSYLRSQIKMPTIQEEPIYSEPSDQDESKIKEFMTILQEKDDNFFQLNQINSNLQTQVSELQDIIESFKIRIAEKDQIIESTQEELTVCRLELNSLKTTPVTDSQKGNSLFAEVEDRRQVMMEKMNSMRSSYQEMKRSFLSKENEIKALKTERAALIRKWEDTAIESVEQETALFDAYKKRITDLENRLKDEQKKHKQLQKEQQSSGNISYFQSLLNSKKKEIEELQTQIENNSIRTLLKAETSYKLANRLRYWRYKAMSVEANLLAVQSQLQTDPNSSTMEILHLIRNQMSNKTLKVDGDMDDEIEMSLKPKIIDETSVSLESLIHPKPCFQPNLDFTLSTDMSLTSVVNDSILESNKTVLANCNSNSNITHPTLNFSQDMSLTQVIEPDSSNDSTLKLEIVSDLTDFQPISASSGLQEKRQKMDLVLFKNNDSNKENNETAGNFSILKSALSKSIKGPDEHKEKKSLRFASNTADPKESYIRRLKDQQKKYPVVHFSSKSD